VVAGDGSGESRRVVSSVRRPAVLTACVVRGLLLTWMAAVRRLRPSQAVAPEADPVPVP
jgi:ABC-type enterobactin transport system permease subunit